MKEFLISKFNGTDMSYTMTWGKYKKKSIEWILDNDMGYIEWLSCNEYVKTNCPKLFAEIKTLLD